jgi:hypothetical protein
VDVTKPEEVKKKLNDAKNYVGNAMLVIYHNDEKIDTTVPGPDMV